MQVYFANIKDQLRRVEDLSWFPHLSVITDSKHRVPDFLNLDTGSCELCHFPPNNVQQLK